MAVFRVEKNKNYVVMGKFHLYDKKISAKAKGLLCVMLGLPDNWKYSMRGLASIMMEGTDAINSMLRELEKAGYLERRQLRGARGRLSEMEYIIREYPIGRENEPITFNPASIAVANANEDSGLSVGDVDFENEKNTANTQKTTETATYKKERVKLQARESKTDSPCTENPYTVNSYTDMPYTEPPCTESPALLSNNILNNNILNNDLLNIESNLILSRARKENDGKDEAGNGEMDFEREKIKANIDYPLMAEQYGKPVIDEIVSLMTETVCTRNKTVLIAGDRFPANYVKSKLAAITGSHIEYVLDSLKENSTKVRNIKKYMLAALFNASSTLTGYYDARVRHDFYNLRE
jgi:hypothetical protein